MPSGRYAVRGRSGDVVGTEDFRCAPGPMGWRYFSEIQREEPTPHREIVDVVVDAAWGIVRARIETGTARDRPGAARRLARRGSGRRGYRDRLGPRHAPRLPDAGVQRDHRAAPGRHGRDRRRLPGTGDASSRPWSRQRYELLGGRPSSTTPVGPIREPTRWRYTALESGWTSELWVAGRRRRALRPRLRAHLLRTGGDGTGSGPVVKRGGGAAAPPPHAGPPGRLSRP